MTTRIYHNPRCSKSRATLALLQARNIEPEVVEYLETPLSAAELRLLLNKLGLPARAIVRTGEAEFRRSGLGPDAPEAALLALIAASPRVMERPVVEHHGRAAIGRPPENVLALFE